MSKRAVIYTRISQDQTGEGAGVARQEKVCRQRIEERGWSLVEVASDNSVSAYKGVRRPGWEQAQQVLRDGRADLIVAYHIDRVTRSMVDLEDLIQLCEQTGAGIHCITGDVDLTDESGRMVARILAAVARQEVERKASRQRLANEQKALAGGKTKGVRPFGYDDDKMTIREDEAAAIRAGAQALLDGTSLGSVARSWRVLGLHPVMTRGGKRGEWTNGGVRSLMLNPRYVGKRAYKGEVVADAQWPAILDEPTFYALRAKLRDPDRLAVPGRKRVDFHAPGTLLAGIATCEKCGGKARANVRASGVATYSCRPGSCFSIPRADADAEVVAAMLEWARSPVAPELGEDEQGAEVDVAGLRERLASLKELRVQLGQERMDGLIDAEQMQAANERFKVLTAELEQQIAAAAPVARPLDVNGSAAEWWDGLELPEMRAAIASVLDVRIRPVGKAARLPASMRVLIDPPEHEKTPSP